MSDPALLTLVEAATAIPGRSVTTASAFGRSPGKGARTMIASGEWT